MQLLDIANPVNPLFAVCCLLVAAGTAHLLAIQAGPGAGQPGRFTTIEGLRGYLAFCVFLHHAAIWYFYARGDVWRVPPSHLYTFLGQGGVAMFFMITGFLFSEKLHAAGRAPVDWLRLYVSRILRLTPLYLFAMGLLFAMVAVVSGGQQRVPASVLLQQVWQWLFFTMHAAPDINGLPDTFVLMAGVTWSLPYEWLFYLSLPALALAMRNRPAWPLVLMGGYAAYRLHRMNPDWMHLRAFGYGVAATYLQQSSILQRFARRRVASVMVVLLLAGAVVLFPTAYQTTPSWMLGAAFCLVACGADLFGLLQLRASRTLGAMAYSIYLLHGLLLYAVLRLLPPAGWLAGLTAWQHWGLMLLLTPVLVLAGQGTYRWIENPFMARTGQVAAALRAGRLLQR